MESTDAHEPRMVLTASPASTSQYSNPRLRIICGPSLVAGSAGQVQACLVQELEKRFDKIFLDVEPIVSHFGWQEQVRESWASAALKERLRLSVGNEIIFHPMDDKDGRSYIFQRLAII